ncbi:O-antigen polysaccharide polymerase Wzy [Halalkalibacter lacteus]|uniref:O-antigen polysaccharide polymerase Wzy n=1 Tax=Halalkalibacter lacteus TaxID=3090663 RepID=UPI002FC8E05A
MDAIMNNKKSFAKLGLRIIVIYTTIIGYISYLLITTTINNNVDYSNLIFGLSWLGVALGVYIVITWYKLTGNVFSLYIIFMVFFFLFNYGQPLMWAFGIHQTHEIGETTLYTMGVPTSAEIVNAQALTLVSILMFHFGAVFCHKPRKKVKKNSESNIGTLNNNTLESIYYTCLIASYIVIPITFYNAVYKLIISQLYGYSAYYYGEDVVGKVVVFNLIEHMFFPCLVGLLIGSMYRKNVKISVYFIFAVYLLISVLSGDRGSWLYKLIILMWMSHTFYKTINFKTITTYSVTSIIGLYLLDAIVSIRNTGISLENIVNSISLKNSSIISGIFEMGASMRPTIVLVKYGTDIWPYGNTYINALLGFITSRIFPILGRPFEPISDWFSQGYLDISYGAGFNIVAEALLNYGPMGAPIFMILLGYLLVSLTYLDKNINLKRQSLRIFFAISTMSIFIHVVRNHFHWLVKTWFYGVVILIILILIMREYINKKKRPVL